MPEKMQPCVYFAERDGLIKIGYSTAPVTRAASLEAKLLKAVPGSRDLERDLHSRFSGIRHRGEWFADTKELRRFIDEQQGIEGLEREYATLYFSLSFSSYDRLLAVAKEQHRPLAAQVTLVLERWLEKRVRV